MGTERSGMSGNGWAFFAGMGELILMKNLPRKFALQISRVRVRAELSAEERYRKVGFGSVC